MTETTTLAQSGLRIERISLLNSQITVQPNFDPARPEEGLVVHYEMTSTLAGHPTAVKGESTPTSVRFEMATTVLLLTREAAQSPHPPLPGDVALGLEQLQPLLQEWSEWTERNVRASIMAGFRVECGATEPGGGFPCSSVLAAIASGPLRQVLWPYWSEYVRSTAGRMLLPNIHIPVMEAEVSDDVIHQRDGTSGRSVAS